MLAIIIVNYKNEQQTIDYIKKEICNIVTPHIVVVVNNSATNLSNQNLCTALDADLIVDVKQTINKGSKYFVISHPDNLGFAKGNNLGAEFSLKHFNIDYFLFTNNDIVFIDKNVVEKLLEKLRTIEEYYAAIGPKVIGLDGKLQSPIIYLSFIKRWFLGIWITPYLPKFLNELIYGLDRNNIQEGQHYSIMGSFILIKARDFIDCNMFDDNTFLYGEEVILSERLLKNKKYIYFYPNVSILHEHGLTIKKNISEYKQMQLQFENDIYYFKTYRKLSDITINFCWITLKIKYLLKKLLK